MGEVNEVFPKEELELLSRDTLHRLGAFLLEIREQIDRLERENEDLMRELAQAHLKLEGRNG